MGKCALGTGAYGVPAPQDYRREPIHRWAEKDGVPLLFLYVAIDSKKTQCVSLFFRPSLVESDLSFWARRFLIPPDIELESTRSVMDGQILQKNRTSALLAG